MHEFQGFYAKGRVSKKNTRCLTALSFFFGCTGVFLDCITLKLIHSFGGLSATKLGYAKRETGRGRDERPLGNSRGLHFVRHGSALKKRAEFQSAQVRASHSATRYAGMAGLGAVGSPLCSQFTLCS